MKNRSAATAKIAAIVALGGLLMGFDASVISGVNKFVQIDFNLSEVELGLSVGSLTLVAAIAMLLAGPLSDRFGRRILLKYCAVIFAISAVGSALAPNFTLFLIFRMLGGIGVGASLILAPMYIGEIAPPASRGKLVSFNQLNIVIGISLAFFSNYLILSFSDSDASWVETLGIAENNWRWMLGVEAVPAFIYFFGLYLVPKSPRWLIMKGRAKEAVEVMTQFRPAEEAKADISSIQKSLLEDKDKPKTNWKELLKPAFRFVLILGLVIGVLQQITGINSVFFYAPMIFEQSGIGTDASFIQAILVGLTNLVFTILAMSLIDKLGRKPLMVIGVSGIAIFLMLLAYGFNTASYSLTKDKIDTLSADIDKTELYQLVGQDFSSDVSYKKALRDIFGDVEAKKNESVLITAAITMNPTLILVGILGFVAAFAISLGPVMWVLFSELFPLKIKGIAISVVGFANSLVSFGVQSIFPWELSTLGSATTFFIYGLFAVLGVVFVILKLPETKGKSLEELEHILIKK